MSNRVLIGLTGRKRTGKDTVAARLIERHGFRRYAFADRVRTAALALDPIVYDATDGVLPVRLSEIVTRHGWERAKANPEVRRILQNYGTTIRHIDVDFWIKPVLRDIADETRPVVVTDVRFADEATAITRVGGVIVRVTRPGHEDDSDTHISETELLTISTDRTITNGGTLADLHSQADELVSTL